MIGIIKEGDYLWYFYVRKIKISDLKWINDIILMLYVNYK